MAKGGPESEIPISPQIVTDVLRIVTDSNSIRHAEEITITVGPWNVSLVYQHGRGGGPTEMHVTPRHDSSPEEIVGGITSTVLREIPWSEVGEQARTSRQTGHSLDEAVGIIARLGSGRPGRKGRDDGFYALLAGVYVALYVLGERNPISALASRTGLNIDTIRTQIREARKRGMLSGQPGKGGGELSGYALELLEAAERLDRRPEHH